MCTAITMKSKTGDVFWGRTMDLDVCMFGEEGNPELPMKILSIPKGSTINNDVYQTEVKYDIIGVGLHGTSTLMDGINEHGLVGDIQVLKECTHMSMNDIKANNLKPLLTEQVVSFVLSQFKSVQEIRDNIQDYALLQAPYSGEGMQVDEAFLGHFTFVDPTGEGIVLEALENGRFTIYESVGVTTNSPQYDWHTTNIRNYIGFTTQNPSLTNTLKNGYELKAIQGGVGYSLTNLPGDWTSPSRFVRSFLVSQSLIDFETEQGFTSLYEAFRQAMVPNGLEYIEGKTISDATRYWIGFDLKNKTLLAQSCRGLAFTSKAIDSVSGLNAIAYDDFDFTNNPVVK